MNTNELYNILLCYFQLDKDPENFNEDDLRLVFEYEAKVAFRNEERQKYRKMLHAEYAKLSAVLNEGIVKFNAKVCKKILFCYRVWKTQQLV